MSVKPHSDAREPSSDKTREGQDATLLTSPITPDHSDSCQKGGRDAGHCDTSEQLCREPREHPTTSISAFDFLPQPFTEESDDYGGPEPCYSDASNGSSTSVDDDAMCCVATSQTEGGCQSHSVKCTSKMDLTFDVDESEETPIRSSNMGTHSQEVSRGKKRSKPYTVTNVEKDGTMINRFSCGVEADEHAEECVLNASGGMVDGPKTPQVVGSTVSKDNHGKWERMHVVGQTDHGLYSNRKRVKPEYTNSSGMAPSEFTCVRSRPWWTYPSNTRNRKQSSRS